MVKRLPLIGIVIFVIPIVWFLILTYRNAQDSFPSATATLTPFPPLVAQASITPIRAPTESSTPIPPLTLTPTDPPPSHPTATQSSTPMPTPTLTPTTDPTATHTPSLTPTTPPTATPIPQLDAVIVYQSGSVNLRSGPGTNYPPLTTLSQGEALTLLGRNRAGDWLNVRVDAQGIAGWVSADSDLVQVNLDPATLALASIPATPTPAFTPTPTSTPTPAYPKPVPLYGVADQVVVVDKHVYLAWQWDGPPLRENEKFSVRVIRKGSTESCFHWQVERTEYRGPLDGCNVGPHDWQVRLALDTGLPGEAKWQDLSPISDEQYLEIVRATTKPEKSISGSSAD